MRARVTSLRIIGVVLTAVGFLLSPSSCARREATPLPAASRAVSADTTLVAPDLSSPVEIVTDRFGIPHVRAANAPDLYFAWGFVTARDRLWQLELSRRSARGEMWQWFGNSKLRDDGGAQLFELRERADRIWQRERADSAVRIPLERYTAGVNAWIARCRIGAEPWPAELVRIGKQPLDWRPEDAVLFLLAEGVLLDLALPELEEGDEIVERGRDAFDRRSRFEDRLIYRTIPDSAASRLYGASRPDTTFHASRGAPRRSGSAVDLETPGRREAALVARLGDRARLHLGNWLRAPDPDGAMRASNEFAVGGGRSASGKPMLANDPHLGLTTPSPFHVIHVTIPGELDAIGATVAGLPAIVSGRNRECAWGITALSADVIDVYADTLSADGRSVRSRAGWVPIREADFAMRFALGPVNLPTIGQKRRYTSHGPVIVYDRKKRVALSARWAGDDSTITLRAMLGIERSTSADEVTRRFRTLVTPGLNVVAADAGGHVIYQAVGAVPRRGFEPGSGPLPSDGKHEWIGLIPPGEMPRWEAPPNGFVVNGNNLPVSAGDEWPRYDWAHDRAMRMALRLAGDPRITLADLRSVQNDLYSRSAERFVPRLLRLVQPHPDSLTVRERALMDTLRNWDYVVRRDRVAPTFFRGWIGALQRRSRLEGLTGLTAAALDGEAPEALVDTSGHAESPLIACLAALHLGVAELEKRLGPDPETWTWGRAHRARFVHGLRDLDPSFQPAPIPADGDGSTPCVGRSNLPWSVTFGHASVFRLLVDLASPDLALGIIPPGNSGDRASGHARDLLAGWANHGYVPLYLDWAKVVGVKESELRLVP